MTIIDESIPTGPTRLVTFLGLGHPSLPDRYAAVSYQRNGRTAASTHLLERAICELETVDSLVVVGTREVREFWIDSGKFRADSGREYEFIEVPKGSTQAELWEIFEKTRSALSEAQRDSETAPPARILLDVTHGFRVQPMLGIGAASFQKSEWLRKRIENPPELQLLYGAYDARDAETNVVPIWDLTPFLAAAEWNAAIDAFMRYGRADDFAALATAESKTLNAEARASGKQGSALQSTNYPKSLANAARTFADDLATARFPMLLKHDGSAAKLKAQLESAERQALEARIPLLKAPLARLAVWTTGLIAPRGDNHAWLRALASLAEIYGNTQRYSEQIAVVREGLIDLFAAVSKRPLSEPGNKAYKRARLALDNELGALAFGAEPKDPPSTDGEAAVAPEASADLSDPRIKDCAKLFREVADPRNDIHHGGLNAGNVSSKSLRETLTKLVNPFLDLMRK